MKRESRSDPDDCDWKLAAVLCIAGAAYLGFLLWAFVYPFYRMLVDAGVTIIPYQ